MGDFFAGRWLHALLARSGLRALVERTQRELELHEQAQHTLRHWKAVLLRARLSAWYPAVVALLAVISAGTGMYPYSPVLVAAVVFAPWRWRVIYFAAAIGAASGAGLLAVTLQNLGDQTIASAFAHLDRSAQWATAQRWIEAYGSYALALIAALPVPEMPALLTLILAKTPAWAIWLAVLAGKLVKYGIYILAVQLLLRAVRARRAGS